MDSLLFLQSLFHGLCEWLVACTTVFWISHRWHKGLVPLPAGLMKHPLPSMMVFGVARSILFLLLAPLLAPVYGANGLVVGLYVRSSYGLTVMSGILLGFAVSSCVMPSTPQQKFRASRAAATGGIVIFASYLVGLLLGFQLFVLVLAVISVTAITLFSARLIVTSAREESKPAESAPWPLWPGLVIGFLPAALFFGTSHTSTAYWLQDLPSELLWSCCIVSVVCCITASVLLFGRFTVGAILGSIVLFLLNAFIALCLGCGAASVNSHF